ncbi:MAG: SGNH/GDSL hydrolase family protein [Capsulimonadaceae bacterium]|nr:SGNH/GDSL hydrolase family protein [Capsulimonadaceae bacterium]
MLFRFAFPARVHCAYAVAATLAIVAFWGSAALAASQPPAASAPFYLRDGDTVVFYGDSITEQRRFTEYIESYCVTRFPLCRYSFINSGWGYETVDGGPGGDVDTRLDRDVIGYHPTVVVICLGANDAGDKPFDRGRFDRFIVGYRHILDALTKAMPGVRLTLISPPAYDDYTRPKHFSGGVNGVLQKYGEGIGELAREYRATFADCNRPLAWFLRAANRNNPALAPSLLPDRVHPRQAGHLVIATAVLKAWHAPSTVFDVALDCATGAELGANRVSGFHADASGVTFTADDCLLPWPFDRDPARYPDVTFLLASTYLERDLDHDTLTVKGLGAGSYRLWIDGIPAGVFSADDLNKGVNLAALHTPMSARADKILGQIRYVDHLHFDLWRNIELMGESNGDSFDQVLARRAHVKSVMDTALAHIRVLAQPSAHRFTIRPI